MIKKIYSNIVFFVWFRFVNFLRPKMCNQR